ncbi:ABC transporter substrate-binding protein [Lacticaseibacillus hulanensis]|uniref:ABC transporter substrate-binding protein n=1 Tax=Lacticaseibacillus hulanensis TaxID=2493111 RepID=UPI000FDC055A|nr:ABC transporter substrate-binding protein [Lacticaseibacillus hulanensis]
MKKSLFTIAAVASALLLAACGKQADAKEGSSQTVKIGILQQVDQAALDDTKKGIVEELQAKGYTKAKIKVLNGQGDQTNLNQMSHQLTSMGNNVNIAIGSAAAQAMEKAGNETPLLFSAITDPVAAGLITKANLLHPNQNATGVTVLVNVKMQLELLHKMFPKAKKIGMMYDAGEPNALAIVKLARKAMKQLGMTPVEMTVANASDVEATARALAKKSDAFFIPNDHVAAVGMNTIGKVSTETKTPVVNTDPTMIQFAGVATKGANFEDIGKQTADMAIKVLKGKKVQDIPVEGPAKIHLVMNKKRMQFFGVSADVLK